MKILWVKELIKVSNKPRYLYYFKIGNKILASRSKGVNKKRRPEYIILDTIPYTYDDIEFSGSQFFNIDRDV